jgi:hypothetical protein
MGFDVMTWVGRGGADCTGLYGVETGFVMGI